MPRRGSQRSCHQRRRLARGLRFEPLEARHLLAADFGDAPLPYPVASHEAIGPTLGALRDTEAASQPTAGADGDGADDDGVTFGPLRVGMLGATVTVNVQNAPSGAKLDAWIDFNGDGNWGGAGEHVFANLAVAVGDNVLEFDVPASAATGASFARFRLSTAGAISIGGAALDGEVEDFGIEVEQPAHGAGVFDPRATLGTATGTFSVAWAMTPVDFDRDGDLDVIYPAGGVLEWLENDGATPWVRRSIGGTGGVVSPLPSVVDFDGDGDLDVLSQFSSSPPSYFLRWFENDGNQSFTAHDVALPGGAGWALVAGDLDADGDLDVAYPRINGQGVNWLENQGGEVFAVRSITGTFAARSLALADLDRDGDLDIAAAGLRTTGGDNRVAWYRNDGGGAWAQRFVDGSTTLSSGAYGSHLSVGDLDGDGDTDLLATLYPDSNFSQSATLTWFENGGLESFPPHEITSYGGAQGIVAQIANLDGDGSADLLVRSGNVADWYEYQTNQGFTRRQPLGSQAFGSTVTAMTAAGDVDGDGVMDALFAEPTSLRITWARQIGLVDPDYGDAPANYPTQGAVNGAVHGGGGPRLGATRDSELDGAASPNADGDGADEDGVTFGTLQVGEAGATVTVNVQNALSGAWLDAWIDFDGDGSWADADEQIASMAVVAGDNVLTFAVPAGAVSGPTFARFRVNTASKLAATGAALDGEVEDYAVTILAPADSTGQYASFKQAFGATRNTLQTVDVDGDGDLDMVTDYFASPYLYWHENVGGGGFLQHPVTAANGTINDLKAIDFDRDGDVDFVVTNLFGSVAWFENNGEQSFRRHSVPPNVFSGSSNSVDVADVDGDGDWDVLVGDAFGPKWLLNNGNQQFTAVSWQGMNPTSPVSMAVAGDVDGDGDVDVVAGQGTTPQLVWFENVGPSLAPVRRALSGGVRDVKIADLDGDGRADIVAHGGSSAYWHKNLGAGAFEYRVLGQVGNPGSPGYVDLMAIADGDGDGDLDVYSIDPQTQRPRWFRNDGGGVFVATSVGASATVTQGAIAVGDINGDGKLEILIGSGNGGGWLEAFPFGDFDRNGSVNQDDRDLWEETEGQTVATPGAGADGNRDGVVDEDDLAVWEAHQGEALTPRVRAANSSYFQTADEKIDGIDFLAWQRTLGTLTFPGGSNDWDYSGVVDAGDLAVWRQQAGAGLIPNSTWINSWAAEAAATPEVAAAVVAGDGPSGGSIGAASAQPRIEGLRAPATFKLKSDVIRSMDAPRGSMRPAYRPQRREGAEATVGMIAARDAALAKPSTSEARRRDLHEVDARHDDISFELVDALFGNAL